MSLTDTQQTIVDESFKELLDKAGEIDPRLKEKLEEKYQQDSIEFSQAAKEAVPSKDPKYWAKPNCNKCYGKGITGTRIILNESAVIGLNGFYANEQGRVDLGCKCVNKAYSKWLVEFRLFYNMLKAQSVADVVNEGQNEDR